MKPTESSKAWRWRWAWAFVFLFLAHAVLVFWAGERLALRMPDARPQPLLHIASDEAGRERIERLIEGADPTLFALPGARGFSGGAWLNAMPSAVTLSNWSEAPNWLPLAVDDLGAALGDFTAASRVSGEALFDGLRAPAPFELRVPEEVISSGSGLVIEGALRDRVLMTMPGIPAVTNQDLLPNTVIELWVGAEGGVESLGLVAECGMPGVDAGAMTAARGMQFEPLPLARRERKASGPTRGRVVFTWQVLPVAATNGLAGRP